MSIDLNALSVQELEDLIEQAADLIEVKKAEALKNAKAEIERIAANVGLSVEQLMGASAAKAAKKAAPARKAVADKFRNPADAGQSWSGRGKRPKWLQEALDKGAKLEDFAL